MWSALSRMQRVSIGLAVVCVAGGLLLFANLRQDKGFRPVLSDMAPEDAGAVVEKLKESGTEYRVSANGTAILVPEADVAETRLLMASAGLPRTGRIGFELFDKTNLGTTDFAEQVNYRRALEGELERSVRSISEVEQARIHLTFPKESVFLESRLPAKASVLIRLRQGGQLSPANIRAVVNLVASAVEGLSPDAVSVTDSLGNLLNKPKKAHNPDEPSDESIEYKQKLERDLTGKVNTTLEPLLGAGKYRVGMTVDCDFTSGEQSEELYDPEKTVMLTSQKTEENAGTASSGGVPGTASALPRPAPRTASGSGGITRRSENITYQSSKVVRRTRMPQGSIKRISASVLLDQNVRWELREGKQQRILVPPAPESVKAIYEVVSAALGLVPARGDQLIIQSLPFGSTLETPPPATPAPAGHPQAKPVPNSWVPDVKDWRVWAVAGGGLLAIVVAALLVRRVMRRKRGSGTATPSLPAAASNAALDGAGAAMLDGAPANRLLAQAQERVTQTALVETLVEELRTSIAGDPALAASVLRTWLEEAKS